jgi:hypothetical protein
MTPEFLDQLIELYPNNYELGDAVRRFRWLKTEYPDLTSIELENKFMDDNFQSNL